MTALRELFASFGVEFDTKALLAGAGAVDGVFGKLQKLGAALAGGAIVGGLVALTSHTIHLGDELSTAAERLGLGTQSLQQWRYVADLADVSAEELGAGLRILQKNIEGAATGGGDAAADFKKVGLSLQDLKGNDLDAILTKAADGFAKLQNPIEKTALAQKLLGRGGAALVPLLSKGSAGVAELKEEFLALGGGLSNETIAAANEADDAFKRLSFGLKGVLYNAVRPLIHFATFLATKTTDLVKGFNQWARGTAIVQGALVALGAVATVMAFQVLVAFAPIIVSVLGIAAAVGAAILVIDDLITLFAGGKSVIGDWIDETYGVGTASKVVETVKGYWEDLGPALSTAWDFLKSILPTIQTIGDAFKALGDDIAFVVDQFRHLSEFKEGLGKLAHDFGVHLGLADETADEKKFKHGAEGFGSTQVRKDAQGNVLAPTGQPGENLDGDSRGGFGFFRNLTRFSGDAKNNLGATAATAGGAVTLPEVKIAGPSAPSVVNNTTNNLHVDANARPDPQLIPTIKKAIADHAGEQARADLASHVGGA